MVYDDKGEHVSNVIVAQCHKAVSVRGAVESLTMLQLEYSESIHIVIGGQRQL